MNIILVRIYTRSNQKTSFYSNENNAIFHTNQKGIFRETERTYGHKKKEYRCTPTFVNLKSNTMKNTLQRYVLLLQIQTFGLIIRIL